jgi:hypothetical protein
MINQPDPTTVLAILKPLMDHATERHDVALAAHRDATALPTGQRGRKAAVKAAADALSVAREGRHYIAEQIAKATRTLNRARVDQVVNDALHRASATPRPLFEAIMLAKDNPRRQIRINGYGQPIHATISFNRYGLPRHVELSKLASLEKTVASLNRWLLAEEQHAAATGRASEQKEQILAGLADPRGYAMSDNGSSITVGLYGEDATPWGINASTWQANNDEQAGYMHGLIAAAFAIRDALNAADLPTEGALYDLHNGDLNG